MIDETLLEAEEKMEKAVEVAKEDFAAIRTGRAHPAMFNKILVDYYGAPTPLNQLASFQVARGRGWSSITPVRQERAARHREGDPRLRPRRQPEQRRQHHPGGASRSSPRSAARSTSRSPSTRPRTPRSRSATSAATPRTQLDKLVKDGEAGEDEGRRAEKELDDLTAKYVAQVDELLKHKEAELLEV